MQKLKVGTLISDNDKLGVITKIIEMGTLDVEVDIINWRANYEIHYIDEVYTTQDKDFDGLIKPSNPSGMVPELEAGYIQFVVGNNDCTFLPINVSRNCLANAGCLEDFNMPATSIWR